MKLWISLVAAVIGLVDSIYLAWIKLADATASCSNIGDCDAVNNSAYAEIGGIPIALLGVGLYALIIGLLIFERKRPDFADTLRLSVFALALAGTLYSGYLTYLEIVVLQAICPFCVLSAVILTGLLVLSILRLREAGEFF